MTLPERLTTRNALLIIGSTFFMIVSIGAVFGFAQLGITDSALLFVGFLLISMAGLAFLAAVYNALGHDTSKGDAFGLPSGSIRALLAIAIMVLFVVFGLPFIRLDSAPSRLGDEPFETVSVPCSALPREVTRYRGRGLLAIPDFQACNVPPNIGSLKLYRETREYSENQLELGKQILTAVITLLTTIIGFYFGSQSAIAAATAATQDPNRTTRNGGDDTRGSPGQDGQTGAGTTGGGTTGAGTTGAGTTGAGTTGAGTTGAGTTGAGTTGAGTTGAGTTGAGTTGAGTTGAGTAGAGTAGGGTTSAGTASGGTTGAGTTSGETTGAGTTGEADGGSAVRGNTENSTFTPLAAGEQVETWTDLTDRAETPPFSRPEPEEPAPA